MTIQSFDSFEEMQAAISAQVEYAKTRIKSFQVQLADGAEHWFLRFVQMGPDSEAFLLVGYIHDVNQLHRQNIAKYGADADPGELEYEHARAVERLDDGFVFTNVFSQLEPRGELGDTHTAVMWEISKEQFESIKHLNYDIADVMKVPELREIVIHWATQVAYQ